LAHLYFNKFPITLVFHILDIIIDGDRKSTAGERPCAHNHQAALSRDAW